jgi:RimJ/RimL family protein N-acetyltransferase
MEPLLRQWKDSDLEPFIAMNADPEVMRFLASSLAGKVLPPSNRIDERGWGLWAVEVEGAFAGLCGLNIPSYVAPFMPCTEIGWRFRPEFWGRGLAYRAALHALQYGFQTLKLLEIVSFTAAINFRSRKLMDAFNFSATSIPTSNTHPFLSVTRFAPTSSTASPARPLSLNPARNVTSTGLPEPALADA